MAIARIEGTMLKANLLRQGVDFAVETDLLYFDVGNDRIGIKTNSPDQALHVIGGATVDNISITTNTITSIDTDGDITFTPDGTGSIIISSDLQTSASTTTRSGLNIAPGVAPTSPNDGDVWLTASDILARVNGVTESLLAANAALGELSDVTFVTEVDGEILRFNGSDWINNTLNEANIPRMTVSGSEPGSPNEGDYWLNSGSAEVSIYANATWEPITYKTELADDAGGLSVNGGFF